jgi:hypothetical protein
VAKSKEPHKEPVPDAAETEDPNRSSKPNKMFEQDPKDIPEERAHSQVPNKNPGKVQPGHRDREEI